MRTNNNTQVAEDDKQPSAAPKANVKRAPNRARLWVGLVVVLVVAGLCALAYWQHHKVTTQAVIIKSLNTNAAKAGKLNTSLKKQVSQLNQQLQAARSTQAAARSNSTSATQSQQPTSSLVITNVKRVPVTNYLPHPATGPTEYQEVDFTVYNNSNSTQFYSTGPGSSEGTPMTNTYLKGVTDAGDLVGSYFPNDNGAIPWTSVVLPGGSGNGVVLFDPASDVVKLQWLAPDSTQPIFITLPSQE